MESLLSFFFPSITNVIRESNENERMKKDMMNRYLKKKKAFGDNPPGKIEPNMLINHISNNTTTTTTTTTDGQQEETETSSTSANQMYKKLRATIGSNHQQIIPLSTLPFDKPIPLFMETNNTESSSSTATTTTTPLSPAISQ